MRRDKCDWFRCIESGGPSSTRQNLLSSSVQNGWDGRAVGEGEWERERERHLPWTPSEPCAPLLTFCTTLPVNTPLDHTSAPRDSHIGPTHTHTSHLILRQRESCTAANRFQFDCHLARWGVTASPSCTPPPPTLVMDSVRRGQVSLHHGSRQRRGGHTTLNASRQRSDWPLLSSYSRLTHTNAASAQEDLSLNVCVGAVETESPPPRLWLGARTAFISSSQTILDEGSATALIVGWSFASDSIIGRSLRSDCAIPEHISCRANGTLKTWGDFFKSTVSKYRSSVEIIKKLHFMFDHNSLSLFPPGFHPIVYRGITVPPPLPCIDELNSGGRCSRIYSDIYTKTKRGSGGDSKHAAEWEGSVCQVLRMWYWNKPFTSGAVFHFNNHF